MKKIINLLMVLTFILNNWFIVYAEESNLNKNKPKSVVKQKVIQGADGKQFNMIEKKKPVVPDVSFGAEEPVQEELIQVSVRNEFDEEIKVKFDTNREYPMSPHESISLGQRKPGKYTLTVYNQKGEFVDNLTKNIDLKNKFVLNKDTVTNSDKITGLTTGQKVAIAAGALGAAAVGSVLINKALEGNNQLAVPPQEVIPGQNQLPVEVGFTTSTQNQPIEPIPQNNWLAEGGMAIKILNIKYPQITITVQGTDGNQIGSGWIIPAAPLDHKPQPLSFNGEKVTITPEQKIKVLLPNNFELQRYGFELDFDSVDGSYVWILR